MGRVTARYAVDSCGRIKIMALLPIFDKHANFKNVEIDLDDLARLRQYTWILRRSRKQGEAENPTYHVVRRLVTNTGHFAWEKLEQRVMNSPRVAFRTSDTMDFRKQNLMVLDDKAATVAKIRKAMAMALSTKPREEMTIQELLAHHILVTVPNYGIRPT